MQTGVSPGPDAQHGTVALMDRLREALRNEHSFLLQVCPSGQGSWYILSELPPNHYIVNVIFWFHVLCGSCVKI